MIGEFIKAKHNRSLVILSGVLLIAFILVFLPTWQALISVWSSSDDYSHGFLIVPLSLYIIWQKRQQLGNAVISPTWPAFPLILFALLLYLVARYAEILTLAPLAMILFLGSGLLFLFGRQVFKLCLFPLFLLVFMVPVPAQIYAQLTIPLQLLVSQMTVFLATLLGVPILREGYVREDREHTLQVVQACSGLRSIMSLLTLGAVIGYFGLKSNISRSVLFVFAIPAAVIANILRVLLMVVAFYFFNYDLTYGTVHTLFGAGIFGLAVVLFLLLRKGLSLCER